MQKYKFSKGDRIVLKSTREEFQVLSIEEDQLFGKCTEYKYVLLNNYGKTLAYEQSYAERMFEYRSTNNSNTEVEDNEYDFVDLLVGYSI